MADYDDRGHRPHATHYGETPRTRIDRGPDGLRVTLDTWGPESFLCQMYDALQANWGDAPSDMATRWPDLLTGEEIERIYAYVDKCFAGGTLPQVLEGLTFWFRIDGCSRATTHQLVRTRIGAAYMQHGGRDNDWRHRAWTMPETLARACDGDRDMERLGCVKDWSAIDRYLKTRFDSSLRGIIEDHLAEGKLIYAALVDAGIPWQDARRLLPMGTQTYIHVNYTYPAMQGVLANRLEHVMDWEINCVAQLMLREIKMKCPPILSRYLGSHSDRQGKAAFAGLESWPPDGKYWNPFERCRYCDHHEIDHNFPDGCHACAATGREENCLVYDGIDQKPRTHRPEQNPFWVLTPAAMAGGPVEWLWTNGVFPEEARTQCT